MSKFAEVIAETVLLAEASKQEPVTERQLREWIAAGKLPGYKVGGRWRIRLSDLDQLVEPVIPSQAS